MLVMYRPRIAQMTERQHRRLAAHYKRRHEQMAKTVANAPRHTVINYHAMWQKYMAHKKAVDNAVSQRETKNDILEELAWNVYRNHTVHSTTFRDGETVWHVMQWIGWWIRADKKEYKTEVDAFKAIQKMAQEAQG